MGYPLPPDPPHPCANCQDLHSRPHSVFCSPKCKQAFSDRARARHAVDRDALQAFRGIMQG